MEKGEASSPFLFFAATNSLLLLEFFLMVIGANK